MSTRRSILTLLCLLLCYAACAQQDSAAIYLNVEDVEIIAPRRLVSTIDHSGNVSLNMSALNGMPRLGGVVDALRTLQYTPGVAATQEGNSALFVRGSDAGQSIILLDGAPLYTPAHLLGFFSSLNTAHLSGITLYKSGIPASYGSSTASIVEVRTHRFVPEKLCLEGNVGLIESDISAHVPVTERFGLFATARHSYSSWLTRIISQKNRVKYDFGDYGLGFVANVGKRSRLIANTHFNNDRAYLGFPFYNSSGDLRWWNLLGTLCLYTDISNNVTMSNVLYGSLYRNLLKPIIVANPCEVMSGVADMGIKSKTTITHDRVAITMGLDYTFRNVQPQHIQFNTMQMEHVVEQSSEAALHGSTRWYICPHLNIDAGLRISLFANERVWCYPEPRVMIEMPISSSLRFWMGYNMLTQYLQLVPQSNISFATDFYITSSEYTPPQLSHNFSVGYAQQSLSGGLRWSVEGYYRYMLNVIEYDSAILNVVTGLTSYHDMIHTGVGESYGVELSLGYSNRDVDVQANYTLSKSLRQFDNINNGMPYPAHSDRRHNLSLLVSYRPTAMWTLSATFIYATGAPYTATEAVYISGNAFMREFGDYNGAKLPDIHHLDLSATYWFKCDRFRQSGINVSVYNVYAHRNPMMISWDVEVNKDESIEITERKHAVYTILPSISWTFKF